MRPLQHKLKYSLGSTNVSIQCTHTLHTGARLKYQTSKTSKNAASLELATSLDRVDCQYVLTSIENGWKKKCTSLDYAYQLQAI